MHVSAKIADSKYQVYQDINLQTIAKISSYSWQSLIWKFELKSKLCQQKMNLEILYEYHIIHGILNKWSSWQEHIVYKIVVSQWQLFVKWLYIFKNKHTDAGEIQGAEAVLTSIAQTISIPKNDWKWYFMSFWVIFGWWKFLRWRGPIPLPHPVFG